MVKVTRDQIRTFINVTPGETKSWQILGTGITDFSIDFNPQNTTEKWIINKNATTTLEGYQMSGSVTQKCYKGDAVFDYINELRRKASVGGDNETELLMVDIYDAEGSAYKATQHGCTISINSYGGGEDAVIEYTIALNGDPVVGTVTIADGTPTFAPNASL